jgi:hypothetical protein
MARVADASKAAVWRQRLERFRRAGQTVAEFCAYEGVSEASYYQWRRKLNGPETPARRRGSRPAFQAVRLTAAPAPLTIHFEGGVRLELPTESLAAVRLVVRELVRQCGRAEQEAP